MVTRVRTFFKGSIHHIPHRTLERRFFFRPDPEVVQNFKYLLALAAEKYGILLHVWFLAANHYHRMVTDTLGDQIPHFMREFDSLLARSMNSFRGRRGVLWDGRYRASEVAPYFAELLHTLVYVSCNPVKDWLVPYASRWLGPLLLPRQAMIEEVIERPKLPFYENSSLPEQVVLCAVLPEELEGFDPEELHAAWIAGHEQKEQEMRAQFQRTGRRCMGMKKIMRQSPDAAPRSRASFGEIIPTIICKNVKARIAWFEWRARRETLYQHCRRLFLNGERNVIFPIGTWFKHIMDGCPREPFTMSFWQMIAEVP